jgi:hypothetical protein
VHCAGRRYRGTLRCGPSPGRRMIWARRECDHRNRGAQLKSLLVEVTRALAGLCRRPQPTPIAIGMPPPGDRRWGSPRIGGLTDAPPPELAARQHLERSAAYRCTSRGGRPPLPDIKIRCDRCDRLAKARFSKVARREPVM